jgi:hyaluronan synthase
VAGQGPVTPRVTFTPRRWLAVAPLLLALTGSLVLHHRLAAAHHLPVLAGAVWGLGLASVAGQLALAWWQRPFTGTPPPLKVAVVIPCYNEDPPCLIRVLESLRAQTRPPERVIVVDDGSTVTYPGVREAFPEVAWIRQDNAGKKHAQAAGFAACPDADVYATIDSDSALAPDALEEGLRPFADPRVQAVAGLEWAHNYRHNLLTRAMGARSLAFQLFAMSSQSAARGNVLIAPGAFSLFRGRLIREVTAAYVGETWCGMPVRLGDDTMLTFQALMAGRVVQQPTAVCFPVYPEKLSHHLRQWTRWMRASTIRQVWRLRYLPLASYGWWFSVWQLGAFTAGVAASVLVAAGWPSSAPLAAAMAGGLVAWPLILAARLACVTRTDLSRWDIISGVALMPVAALWYLLVLRQIRFYGVATCARQGWVTRQQVEVRLHEPAAPGRAPSGQGHAHPA